MNIENIISERIQEQKAMYYIIPFIQNVIIGKFIEHKHRLVVARASEEGGMGWSASGMGFLFEVVEGSRIG